MTDERMKELMAQVGYPQSHSIAQLILQVENETAQHWQKKTAFECYQIVGDTMEHLASPIAPYNHGVLDTKIAARKAIKETFRLEI